MLGYRSLRAATVALGLYGVLGLLIAVVMLAVGLSSFNRIAAVSATLERERVALVQALHTASATLGDTATTTANVQQSVATARTAADQGSKLSNDSAGDFRDLANSLGTLNVFGIQPLAGLSPQFDRKIQAINCFAGLVPG